MDRMFPCVEQHHFVPPSTREELYDLMNNVEWRNMLERSMIFASRIADPLALEVVHVGSLLQRIDQQLEECPLPFATANLQPDHSSAFPCHRPQPRKPRRTALAWTPC